VTEGVISFTIGGESFTLGVGDVAVIPRGVEHSGASIIGEAIFIEVFTPLRIEKSAGILGRIVYCPGTEVAMAPQRITPKVIVETEHFGSNNSIVVGESSLVLIDSPHCLTDATNWRAYAEQFGSIRFVINSDHHPDHTIGNYVMPGDVVAHRGTRARLLSEEAPSREYLVDLMKRIDPESVPIFENEYEVRVPNIVFDSELEIHLSGASLELTFSARAYPQQRNHLLPRGQGGVFRRHRVRSRIAIIFRIPRSSTGSTPWMP